VAKGSDWRARYRAQTRLYFDEGLSAKAIVALQDLNIDTVYNSRKNWLSKGFAVLYDVRRSGTCVSVLCLPYTTELFLMRRLINALLLFD
jgi:hypothetical protein